MRFECYFDGSITRNPGGDMGIGGVVYEIVDGQKQKVHDFSDKLPAKLFPNGTSCNVAEALALNKLLSFFILENMQHATIQVYGDSQVIINAAIKRNGKSKGMFAPYVNEAIKVIPQFKNIGFKWVPREHNKEADAISR